MTCSSAMSCTQATGDPPPVDRDQARHVPAQTARREAADRRPAVDGRQARAYVLPPLKECRALLSEKLGQPVAWPAEWENQEWQQNDNWLDVLKKMATGRAEGWLT